MIASLSFPGLQRCIYFLSFKASLIHPVRNVFIQKKFSHNIRLLKSLLPLNKEKHFALGHLGEMPRRQFMYLADHTQHKICGIKL